MGIKIVVQRGIVMAWVVSRGDEDDSWWEVNRIPDFYKNKE